MTDLVPVIYALRSSLNEARPLPEQAEVVMDCMLRLERLYSAFDDLEIVVAEKQLLAEHLVNDGKEFTVKNHVQGKGFEPIKRALVHAHVPDSLSVAEMLTYQFKPSASKKQKSGGFSYAFDFDNMPMFESLDACLDGLRTNITDSASLRKLMGMDLSELIDHPQWEETLHLLCKSVSAQAGANHECLVLAMFQRFAVGFAGTSQGLDTIACALRYLLAEWALAKDRTAVEHVVVRAQLALFVVLLQCCAASLQVPYQKEADRVIVLLFQLFSKGRVQVTTSSTLATTHDAVRSVPSIDALAGTKGDGDALVTMLSVVHPLSAFSYAVETGLLGTLLQPSSPEVGGAPAVATVCLRLRVVLSLVSAFSSSQNVAVAFIESCAMTEAAGGSAFHFAAYEWRGDLAQLAAAPAIGRGAAVADVVAPVEGTNKRFLHVTQPNSVVTALFDLSAKHVSTDGVRLLEWVSRQLTLLLPAVVGAVPPTETSVRLGDALRLALQVCATYCEAVEPAAATPLVHAIVQSALQLERALATQSNSAAEQARMGIMRGLLAATEVRDTGGAFPWAKVCAAVTDWGVFGLNTSAEVQDLQDCALTFVIALAGDSSADCAALLVDAVHFATSVLPEYSPMAAASPNIPLLSRCICVLRAALGRRLEGSVRESVVTALLSVLVQSQYEPLLSENARHLTIEALPHYFAGVPTSEVSRVLNASNAEPFLVRALIMEAAHPGCFERAYSESLSAAVAGAGDTFPAVFPLLLVFMQLGHADVVGGVAAQGWGAEMGELSAGDVVDLPLLHALTVQDSDLAAQLESTGVFPYLLRLMTAGLSNAAYIEHVRRHLTGLPSPTAREAGEDGVDIRSVFSNLTQKALNGQPVAPAMLLRVSPC
jgi:hypothetical protein